MTLWSRRTPAARHAPAAALAAACLGLASLSAAPALADTAQPSPGASPDGAPEQEALPAIGTAPDGECVSPSPTVVSEQPWTTPLLDLPRAWDLSEGDGVTIAVLSTGVDAGTAAVGPALSGPGSEDCEGYGTFLAGLVAGRPQSDSGLAGVAPAARVIDVPVTNAQGASSATSIADGIETAISEGARVVLVGTAVAESNSELESAMRAAAEADALVVAPATVSVNRTFVPASPGAHPSAVSVAAVGVDGTPVANFSALDSDGAAARVDMTAPGDLIVSVGPGGDGHFVGAGDVVAAGFVAGTAALLLSYEPDLSASDARERLLATAYPSPYGPGDALRGSGRVDPVGALSADPGASTGTAHPGTGFVPDPGPGDVSPPSVAVVVGGATALILTTVAAGVLIPRGRKRAWRAALPGERRSRDPEPRRAY